MSPENRTRTHEFDPGTHTFDPALDAGLAAAFGPDPTPGGWSHPPLLRDDPSDFAALVQPSSAEMPRGAGDRYQLLGEIARGGMGVVLKGRDPDLGRDLAFKVLKADMARRPAAVQRFVEEAQIGGQLQHPGVVPVYDLGRFADGRPYFAMKLVKGRTLADLLAERKAPSDDRGRFLHVFLQVCQTVAYAHAKGVIHRDLKPSNVMVGAFGETLVMDWGLAKVLPRGGVADEDKASVAASVRRAAPLEEPTVIQTARSGSGGSDTQAGSVMGTPAFMPPEQAGGEIEKLDERADVFGLGAILCVILTGEPPYLADTADAIRLMAVRGDLENAFARLDGCHSDADLVALCRRCLASKRDARPRHAGEVAGELGAHLAGVEQRAQIAEVDRAAAEARAEEAVHTRRMAEGRAREERKRRKVQALLGTAVLLVLLAGGSLAAWQWRRADREEANTRRALDQVTAEKDKTAAALAKLTEEQTRTFAALNAMTDEGVERLFQAQAEVSDEQKLFVQKVIALYDQATESRIDTPAGRAARADGHNRVGRLRVNIGDNDGGAASNTEAVRLYAELHAEFPDDPAYRYGLALARLDLGLAYVRRGRGDADKETRAAQALLAALVTGPTANPDYRYQLARAFVNLKLASHQSREREAIALIEPLIREFPDRSEYTTLLVTACNNLSNDFGRVKVAERVAILEKALAAIADHAARRPSTLKLRQAEVQTRLKLTAGYIDANDATDAVKEAKTARDVAAKLARDYPAVAAHRNTLATAHMILAETWTFANRRAEAAQEYTAAVPVLRQLADEFPDRFDYTRMLFAALTAAARYDATQPQRLAAAAAGFKSALGVGEKATASGKADRNFRHLLARCRCDLAKVPGQTSLAVATNELRRAIAEYQALYESSPPAIVGLLRDRVEAHTQLGTHLRISNQLKDAAAELNSAIRLDESFAPAHYQLGLALSGLGDGPGAIAAFEKAAALNKQFVSAHYQIGLLRKEAKDNPGAIAAFRQAAAAQPKNPAIRQELGVALQAAGDLAGAEEQFQEWVKLVPDRADPRSRLGFVRYLRKNYKEAAADYREATRLAHEYARYWWELAMILRTDGDAAGAVTAARRAVDLLPKENRAHYELGLALGDAGNHLEAVAVLREAHRLTPLGTLTRVALARALAAHAHTLRSRGDIAGCVEHLEESLRVYPGWSHAMNDLAWVLATSPDADQRDGRRAVRLATRACEVDEWKNNQYLGTLAAAHAETGEYDKAVEHQKRLLADLPDAVPEAPAMRARLKLYQQKQPYRTPAPSPREVAPPPRVKR